MVGTGEQGSSARPRRQQWRSRWRRKTPALPNKLRGRVGCSRSSAHFKARLSSMCLSARVSSQARVPTPARVFTQAVDEPAVRGKDG
jgi:hypothetical protein